MLNLKEEEQSNDNQRTKFHVDDTLIGKRVR